MGPPLEKVPDQIANFKEWVSFFFLTLLLLILFCPLFSFQAAQSSAQPIIDLVGNHVQKRTITWWYT